MEGSRENPVLPSRLVEDEGECWGRGIRSREVVCMAWRGVAIGQALASYLVRVVVVVNNVRLRA